MKSWRMLALVLLGTQAGGVVNAATPVVPDDYVNVDDAVPPAVPVLTDEQRIDALIVSFNASLASITSKASADARLAGYRDSLALLDQIRLDRPTFDFKPGLNTLIANYVDELNGVVRKLTGVERTRIRGEVRGVLLRLSSAKGRVEKLLDIARIESDSADPADVLPTLQSMLADLSLLDVAERDKALQAAIGIVARPGRELPSDTYFWLADIKDARRRAESVRLIAETAVSRDAKLLELMGSSQIGSDRDIRLLDISDFMTRKGNWEAATWTAVLASPTNTRERDAALAVVIDDVIAANRGEFHAVHAIADPALRDRKLLDIVGALLETQRLADARTAIGYMQPGPENVFAWLRVGTWLQQKDLNRQATDAADKADAVFAKMNLPRGEMRDRLLERQAELAANLGQRDRALKYIGQITGLEYAGRGRLALIRWLIADSSLDQALDEIAHLARGPIREQATVDIIEALARARRWDEIGARLGELSQPLARLDARVYMIKALKRPEDVKPADPVQPSMATLAAEIESLAESLIKAGTNRSDAHALRAIARAAAGRYPQARGDLQDATSSERYEDALAYVAARQTVTDGSDAGVATANLAWKVTQRQRALIAVSLALAERGEIEKATGMVRAFTDDHSRVETFHKMAKVAARRLDQFGLIDSATGTAPDAPSLSKLKNLQLLSASDGKQLFAMPNPNLGRVLPSVPALRGHMASAIANDVPAIKPGAIHVLPMEYSDFNEKFLASLSYAFNDYGGRLFYFDAQKSAYPVFISLDEGVFDLPAIARYLESTGQSRYLLREGRRYTLTLPMLISPKATLVISGTDVDEFRMTRDTGAYLVNAGRLISYDTRITGWDASRNKPAALDYKTRGNFRPFIVNWSGSVGDFGRSTITHLGFLGAKGYGISYTAGPETLLKSVAANLRPPTGRLYDNSFQQMLYGLYTYEADAVLAVGNEYRDNVIYGLDPHDRSGALLLAYNTSYGTGVKHGIIVSRGVDNSWIVGNLTFDNAGSGIMLDRDSVGNFVYANSSFGNKNDGVALFESSCNIIASNLVMRNKRDGFKARNSWDVGVFANQLIDNGGVGVNSYVADLASESLGHVRDFELDPYFKIADIAIVDNIIKGNVGGVSLKGMAGFSWKGNQVIAQPRPYTGMTKGLVNDLFKRSDRGLYVRTACPEQPTDYRCSFKTKGYLAGTSQYDTSVVSEAGCASFSPPRVAAAAGLGAAATGATP